MLSVTAVARGVPDREAEEFFGYVLRLSLEDGPSALDPESWAASAVPSGGTTFAGEAEIFVYGDGRTRAMTIVSTADFVD